MLDGVDVTVDGKPNLTCVDKHDELCSTLQIGDALFVDLPRIRLDGGAKAFRQRWGYEVSPPPTLLEVEEEDGADGNEDEGETVSLREEGIIPTSSPLGKSYIVFSPPSRTSGDTGQFA